MLKEQWHRGRDQENDSPVICSIGSTQKAPWELCVHTCFQPSYEFSMNLYTSATCQVRYTNWTANEISGVVLFGACGLQSFEIWQHWSHSMSSRNPFYLSGEGRMDSLDGIACENNLLSIIYSPSWDAVTRNKWSRPHGTWRTVTRSAKLFRVVRLVYPKQLVWNFPKSILLAQTDCASSICQIGNLQCRSIIPWQPQSRTHQQ